MNPKQHVHTNTSSDSLMHLLFCGDCREILPHIKPSSVHLVVTSPPYNLKTDYDGYDDNLSNDAYWQFTKAWLCHCYQLLCPSGQIAVNIPLGTRVCGNAFFPNIYTLMRRVGFIDVATIVWVKEFADSGRLICPPPKKAPSPTAPHFRRACELIVVMKKLPITEDCPDASAFIKGFPLPHKPNLSPREYADWTMDVWKMETEPNRIAHPAPFPLQLPLRLIKLLTVPGNTVLDPFVGSGTTLKACDLLGRRGLGCELSPQYIELTEQRVGSQKVRLVTEDELIQNGGHYELPVKLRRWG